MLVVSNPGPRARSLPPLRANRPAPIITRRTRRLGRPQRLAQAETGGPRRSTAASSPGRLVRLAARRAGSRTRLSSSRGDDQGEARPGHPRGSQGPSAGRNDSKVEVMLGVSVSPTRPPTAPAARPPPAAGGRCGRARPPAPSDWQLACPGERPGSDRLATFKQASSSNSAVEASRPQQRSFQPLAFRAAPRAAGTQPRRGLEIAAAGLRANVCPAVAASAASMASTRDRGRPAPPPASPPDQPGDTCSQAPRQLSSQSPSPPAAGSSARDPQGGAAAGSTLSKSRGGHAHHAHGSTVHQQLAPTMSPGLPNRFFQ